MNKEAGLLAYAVADSTLFTSGRSQWKRLISRWQQRAAFKR